jgi:hypothetical protein
MESMPQDNFFILSCGLCLGKFYSFPQGKINTYHPNPEIKE